MNVFLNGRDISPLTTRITIDKTISAAAAQAEITAACAPMDPRLTLINPACGQSVCVSDGEKELFSGSVERVSYDAAGLTLTILCLDGASMLAKNQCRGPFTGTPAQIAAQLCRECNLQPGALWDCSPESVTLPPRCGRSAFHAIRQLYDDQCVTDFRGGLVEIYPVGGETGKLDSGVLLSLTSRCTAEDAVNRVQVYTSAGKLAADCAEADSIRECGMRQRTESLSSTVDTAQKQAEAGLRGVSRQARAVITGNPGLRCGMTVALEKPAYGLSGEYLITEITLTCWAGAVTTALGMVHVS